MRRYLQDSEGKTAANIIGEEEEEGTYADVYMQRSRDDKTAKTPTYRVHVQGGNADADYIAETLYEVLNDLLSYVCDAVHDLSRDMPRHCDTAAHRHLFIYSTNSKRYDLCSLQGQRKKVRINE